MNGKPTKLFLVLRPLQDKISAYLGTAISYGETIEVALKNYDQFGPDLLKVREGLLEIVDEINDKVREFGGPEK